MYGSGVAVGVSFRGSPWLVPNERAVLAETGPPFVSRFLGSAACSVVRHLSNGFERFDRSDPYVSVRAVRSLSALPSIRTVVFLARANIHPPETLTNL